jgi:hypothetical protein
MKRLPRNPRLSYALQSLRDWFRLLSWAAVASIALAGLGALLISMVTP